MQLIIERQYGATAGTVFIDGRAQIVDCRTVQPEIVSVRWDDDHGTITYSDGTVTGLGDIMRFKHIIDLWHDANNALQVRDGSDRL